MKNSYLEELPEICILCFWKLYVKANCEHAHNTLLWFALFLKDVKKYCWINFTKKSESVRTDCSIEKSLLIISKYLLDTTTYIIISISKAVRVFGSLQYVQQLLISFDTYMYINRTYNRFLLYGSLHINFIFITHLLSLIIRCHIPYSQGHNEPKLYFQSVRL